MWQSCCHELNTMQWVSELDHSKCSNSRKQQPQLYTFYLQRKLQACSCSKTKFVVSLTSSNKFSLPHKTLHSRHIWVADMKMTTLNTTHGSLMIRITFRPAIVPASFVACRWAWLKYAGTVTTACVTFLPRYASAVSFIFIRTIADISSGVNVLVSDPTLIWNTNDLMKFTWFRNKRVLHLLTRSSASQQCHRNTQINNNGLCAFSL